MGKIWSNWWNRQTNWGIFRYFDHFDQFDRIWPEPVCVNFITRLLQDSHGCACGFRRWKPLAVRSFEWQDRGGMEEWDRSIYQYIYIYTEIQWPGWFQQFLNPSENYFCSSVGMIIFKTWNNKTCSKPPTRMAFTTKCRWWSTGKFFWEIHSLQWLYWGLNPKSWPGTTKNSTRLFANRGMHLCWVDIVHEFRVFL